MFPGTLKNSKKRSDYPELKPCTTSTTPRFILRQLFYYHPTDTIIPFILDKTSGFCFNRNCADEEEADKKMWKLFRDWSTQHYSITLPENTPWSNFFRGRPTEFEMLH